MKENNGMCLFTYHRVLVPQSLKPWKLYFLSWSSCLHLPLIMTRFTLSQGKAQFWQSANVFTIQNCWSSCISVPCSASMFLVKFKKGAIPSFVGCCVEVRLQRHGFVQPPGSEKGLNLRDLCALRTSQKTPSCCPLIGHLDVSYSTEIKDRAGPGKWTTHALRGGLYRSG